MDAARVLPFSLDVLRRTIGDTLLRRRWLRLDEEWTVRLSRAVPAAQAPELPDHRAAVVEVLEVVAWALRSELGPLQPR